LFVVAERLRRVAGCSYRMGELASLDLIRDKRYAISDFATARGSSLRSLWVNYFEGNDEKFA
jgi:hypothetical protein